MTCSKLHYIKALSFNLSHELVSLNVVYLQGGRYLQADGWRGRRPKRRHHHHLRGYKNLDVMKFTTQMLEHC